MTRPAPNTRWRFSLRTLVILMLVMPPLALLAWKIINPVGSMGFRDIHPQQPTLQTEDTGSP